MTDVEEAFGHTDFFSMLDEVLYLAPLFPFFS